MPIVQHKKGPADQLLEHLEAIPEFQPAVQESTLLNSLLATEHLSPFEQFFKDAKRTASVINGVDCHTRLQTLGSASLGTMIPQIQDQFGSNRPVTRYVKRQGYVTTLIYEGKSHELQHYAHTRSYRSALRKTRQRSPQQCQFPESGSIQKPAGTCEQVYRTDHCG